MLGWMLVNSLVSILLAAGVAWSIVNSRARTSAAVAQARMEQLDASVASAESRYAKLREEHEALGQKCLEESKLRAGAETAAAQIPDLKAQLDKAASTIGEQTFQIARLQTEMRAGQKALDDQRDLLQETQRAFADSFKALSADALQNNNQAFLALAKTTLENYQDGAKGDLQARQVAVDQMIQPIRESLLKVDSKLGDIELQRVSAYSALTEQLRGLVEIQLPVLHKETANLVKALRQPTVRGRYGEVQLKRVVEMAGMLDHCDFLLQENRTTEEGRLRPDMVVNLPGGRNIVVDAKTPMAAYLEAMEAPDEESQRVHLLQHAQQFRQHITALSRKAYWEQFTPTPEIVVMFVPGEAFYNAALQADPTLLECGAQEKVILATPGTLIALLRAIAYGWRQEKLAENAEEVAKLGKELYERISTLAKHWGEVGERLSRTVDSYNSSTATMESRVLVSARRFRDLQVSSDSVEIKPSRPVEVIPRLLQADEATPQVTLMSPAVNGKYLT